MVVLQLAISSCSDGPSMYVCMCVIKHVKQLLSAFPRVFKTTIVCRTEVATLVESSMPKRSRKFPLKTSEPAGKCSSKTQSMGIHKTTRSPPSRSKPKQIYNIYLSQRT